MALLARGHNSKIGYPYLPAWGTGRPTKSLAGDGRPWQVSRQGRRTTLVGTPHNSRTRKQSLADDSGRDGGRLWQGRRTTLAGTGGDSGGETLAKTWRATLARKNSGRDLADDSGGDSARLWRSQKKLGGRTTLGEVDDSCGDRQRLWWPSLAGGNLAAGDPWRGGWRATPAGTADDSGGRRRDVPRRAWRATLAGMAGESGRETTLAGLFGGRIWWGLRTSLALASSSLADGTVDESQSP